MVDRKIVEEWLNKADEDFGYASTSLEEELEYFPQICFHFQQAAEKYLKAFIVAQELPFKKIHDLRALLKTCRKHDDGLTDLTESCEKLNQFYVESRYPVHWPTKFTKQDAVEAREAAEIIGRRIKSLLFENSSSP